MGNTRTLSVGMVFALLVAPAAVQAAGFAYRPQCPEQMTLVESEAYFCRTMGHKDLGKRVEAAYQAQVAHLKTIYDKPDDTGNLQHELAVLEAGQKGWETYAANQCAAEGYMAWHGSLEPQLVGECAQRLSEARIKELEALTEGLGN